MQSRPWTGLVLRNYTQVAAVPCLFMHTRSVSLEQKGGALGTPLGYMTLGRWQLPRWDIKLGHVKYSHCVPLKKRSLEFSTSTVFCNGGQFSFGCLMGKYFDTAAFVDATPALGFKPFLRTCVRRLGPGYLLRRRGTLRHRTSVNYVAYYYLDWHFFNVTW